MKRVLLAALTASFAAACSGSDSNPDMGGLDGGMTDTGTVADGGTTACTMDEDCPTGLECDIVVGECKTACMNGACPMGGVCIGGFCEEPPACPDGTCPGNLICNAMGMCEEPPP